MNTVDGGNPKPDDDEYDAYEELTKPVCAFITFASDNDYNEALLFSKKNWFQRKYEEY